MLGVTHLGSEVVALSWVWQIPASRPSPSRASSVLQGPPPLCPAGSQHIPKACGEGEAETDSLAPQGLEKLEEPKPDPEDSGGSGRAAQGEHPLPGPLLSCSLALTWP